jgi:hypothetical protein
MTELLHQGNFILYVKIGECQKLLLYRFTREKDNNFLKGTG